MIYAIFAAHWIASVFFQSFFQHRYAAHRMYTMKPRTERALHLLTYLVQGPSFLSPRGYAILHRQHHAFSDTDRDPHSPMHGFWWSHVGWILSGRYGDTHLEDVPDLARFPELRFLDRHDWIGPWALAVTCWLIGGWSGLVVGFFGSTLLVWHATFLVNSAAHVFGRRRYDTNDTSRNSVFVAVATMGEGWHNNHHHDPNAARQGRRWYELDPTFGVLRVLRWLGFVWEVREPRHTSGPERTPIASRIRV